ncbi:hypothetical protein [Kingella potus]|uniref:hypothetical protein n=1 Tax=Kingella potus TaxID=265175 RepID=UPI001FD2170C|nr:hypothetical protein [Kingella potus]UOP01035.1 hypothetical protein LVJ84_01250 [Kingella potus]
MCVAFGRHTLRGWQRPSEKTDAVRPKFCLRFFRNVIPAQAGRPLRCGRNACVAFGRHTLRDASNGRMLFTWLAVNKKYGEAV